MMSRRRSRAGYLYVAVLFTSLVVGAAIATAISLDTTRIKSKNAQADRGAAIRLAESELHRVAVQLAADPEWRTSHTEGTLSAWVNRGIHAGNPNALTRYQINDPDGDLSDDPFDIAQVVAHAQFGSAQAAVAVNLESGYAPMDLLRYGITATDDLTIESNAAVVSERPIQVVDDTKTYSSGMVTTSTLECSGSIQVPVRGDIATSNVETPPFDVVQRYIDVGTEISIDSLSWRGGDRAIYRALLSKTQNPYGAVDPNGIYWIDADGDEVVIEDSRIDATLAIKDAAYVAVRDGIVWERTDDPGAILVTDSNIYLSDIDWLDEAVHNRNFNPASTPYRGDMFNSTRNDRYPPTFRGVIYSSWHVFVLSTADGSPLHVTGSIVARDLRVYHTLHVHALDELMTNVPIGFVDIGPQRFLSGTFRRVPLP